MLGGPVTSFPVTCARFLQVDSKSEVLAGKAKAIHGLL